MTNVVYPVLVVFIGVMSYIAAWHGYTTGDVVGLRLALWTAGWVSGILFTMWVVGR